MGTLTVTGVLENQTKTIESLGQLKNYLALFANSE
jgi:hypothetical protein